MDVPAFKTIIIFNDLLFFVVVEIYICI